MSYCRLLAQYPHQVLIIISILSTICLILTFTVCDMPDFRDPRLGFEARGTEISKRLLSLHNMYDNTSRTSHVLPPSSPTQRFHYTEPRRANDTEVQVRVETMHRAEEEEEKQGVTGSQQRQENETTYEDAYFCDVPRKTYARVVFTNHSGASLLTIEAMRAMCRLDRDMRAWPAFTASCIRTTHSHECCRSWSLSNYVSQLAGKSTCAELTTADVTMTHRLLKACMSYYRDGRLKADCSRKSDCAGVRSKCQRHNAVYNMLHYLSDVEYADTSHLSYSLAMLPLASGTGASPLYHSLKRHPPENGDGVVIAAMEFGIKQAVFDHLLIADSIWLGAAACATVAAIWIYTASIFVTVTTLTSMVVALDVAFVVYTHVFSIRFFPFVNLLAVVVLVAVGADGVFVFTRAWRVAKLESDGATLTRLVADTFSQAALPICVSSLSTAAAFYANAVNQVTALGCFAIFAGTTAITNLFMLVTCVPAAVVIHEKWQLGCHNSNTTKSRRVYGVCARLKRLPAASVEWLRDWARVFFEKLLPCIVVRLRLSSILIFGGASVCGIIGVFYWPRLRLPTSERFQLFVGSHPFEVYDIQMRQRFAFERTATTDGMPLTVVWGVEATDNGDRLEPLSRGTPVYDTHFNMSSPAAQAWLLKFCRSLRSTDMYRNQAGMQLTNCFIENYRHSMEADCVQTPQPGSIACCGHKQFPYSSQAFCTCLPAYAAMLEQSRLLYPVNPFAGPRFCRRTGHLVAMVVEFASTQPFSLSYTAVRHFEQRTNTWVHDQLTAAPDGLRNGWFSSQLNFYSLQDALAAGVPRAAAVAVAAAAAVSFIATLNVVITILAFITVISALFSTAGILVLLGWQLDVVEAVAISAAVGLSVDFTLHYGIAYRLSPSTGRQARVVCATTRISAPVAMAMLTTVIAGVLMLPATVLAYRRLGVFLTIVTAVSWCYATFFFQALLLTFGPDSGFAQLHWPRLARRRRPKHRDKTVYCPSSSPPPSTDIHELDSLVTYRDTVVTTVNNNSGRPVMATVECTNNGHRSNGIAAAVSIGSLLDAVGTV